MISLVKKQKKKMVAWEKHLKILWNLKKILNSILKIMKKFIKISLLFYIRMKKENHLLIY